MENYHSFIRSARCCCCLLETRLQCTTLCFIIQLKKIIMPNSSFIVTHHKNQVGIIQSCKVNKINYILSIIYRHHVYIASLECNESQAIVLGRRSSCAQWHTVTLRNAMWAIRYNLDNNKMWICVAFYTKLPSNLKIIIIS